MAGCFAGFDHGGGGVWLQWGLVEALRFWGTLIRGLTRQGKRGIEVVEETHSCKVRCRSRKRAQGKLFEGASA